MTKDQAVVISVLIETFNKIRSSRNINNPDIYQVIIDSIEELQEILPTSKLAKLVDHVQEIHLLIKNIES